MRFRFLPSLLLLGWFGNAAAGDNFAAVPGTGWTDIRELQSTCSLPGYFVNPTDCSRFYVCVDHSTPENKLLLRYDFDCPGGLAFDESTSNCNYPGPSGCVENGGASGGGGSGGGGWGWGWNKNPGIFQSTSTVTRYPAWGAAQTSVGQTSSQTITRGPTSTGTFYQVGPTPTPSAVPSNPRLNLPSTTIVHIPATHWESQRITPLNTGVFQAAKTTASGGGWSQTSRVVNSGSVFQSGRVSIPSNPTTVAWGSAKILPVDTGTVFQSARVAPVPPAQWEVPRAFPPVQQTTVVQESGGGWGAPIRGPTPTPIPSNPSGPGVIYTVTSQPITWQAQSSYVAPTPSPAFQATRITQTSPTPASVVFQSARVTPTQSYGPPPVPFQATRVTQNQAPVSFQATRVTQSQAPVAFQATAVAQSQAPVAYQTTRLSQSETPSAGAIFQSARVSPTPQPFSGWQNVRVTPRQPANPSVQIQSNSLTSAAANPSLQIPAPPGGWESVRYTELPSGYFWQTKASASSASQQESNVLVSTPSPILTAPESQANLAYTQQSQSQTLPAQSGNFGIIQQVINEAEGQAQSGETGKSHIQLIYETREKQNQNTAAQGIASAQVIQQQQQQQQAIVQTNELQNQNQNGPVYEIITSPESLPKGRIIVLYAPLSKGGAKREVPVVEVEVEEDDENENEDNSK